MEIGMFGRIGVLMGGPSTEREISLKSGEAVFGALKGIGLNVIAIDINTESEKENIELIKYYNIDCAFLALHGRFGEDGGVQKILETLGIPYTGSGIRASKLALDKVASRKIFAAAKLDVPRYIAVNKNSNHKNSIIFNKLGLPLVIKPATHGSSIGLSIIDREGDFNKALDLAFNFDSSVIIEEYIQGRELTVGVLEERSLPIIEIIPKKRFFDFEAKYQPELTDYIVPAKLEARLAKKIQYAAFLAHKLLGCFGCSRVDIILSKKNIPFILEVNTIPGLTKTSLLPKAARCLGIEFPELCLKLIQLAYEKTHKLCPSN